MFKMDKKTLDYSIQLLDRCAELSTIIREFTDNLSDLVDKTIEEADLLNHAAIESDYKAKAANEDITHVKQCAYKFVDKVDDFFVWKGSRTKTACK